MSWARASIIATTGVAQAHDLARALSEGVAWQIVRAARAPVNAGLLVAHLGGDERRIDADELYEWLDGN